MIVTSNNHLHALFAPTQKGQAIAKKTTHNQKLVNESNPLDSSPFSTHIDSTF